MHRDTLQHPKFLLLARRLDIPRPYAAGLLESIWHFTAQYTPDGRIGKYTPAMVAEFIGYPDDPDTLFETLADTGWLDNHPDGRRVHDWPDHCDDAVHMRLARAGLRFANGQAPKLTRLSKKERIQAEALLQANDARRAHKQRTTGAHPQASNAAIPATPDAQLQPSNTAALSAMFSIPHAALRMLNAPPLDARPGLIYDDVQEVPARSG